LSEVELGTIAWFKRTADQQEGQGGNFRSDSLRYLPTVDARQSDICEEEPDLVTMRREETERFLPILRPEHGNSFRSKDVFPEPADIGFVFDHEHLLGFGAVGAS